MPGTLPATTTTTTAQAPDIGDVLTHDNRTCVVTGWLKQVQMQPLPDDLAALFPDLPPHPPLLVFCDRADAEYVSAYHGDGLIIPIADTTVTGRANWPAQHLAHARRRAHHLIGSYAQACQPHTTITRRPPR